MCVTERTRDDQLGELSPEHVRPPPAEDGLSGGVPVDDQPARVHDDDRVGHGGKHSLALTRWFHDRRASVRAFEQTRNRINTYRVAAVDGTLQIDIGHHDGATVLSVAGEIDLATAPMLDEKITAAFQAGTEDTVIVDLDRVSFMDSSGLQVLLSHIFSEQNGRRIRLTKGSPQVYRLFEVSGMVDQLPFTSGD